MKLYLKGHDYKYATEQMMLTLFPQERPEYPQEATEPGENALVLTLTRTDDWAAGRAVLTWGGKVFEQTSRAPDPGESDPLERDRVLQRVLKTAFYRAGTQALGREPAWGALTGVRPVKIPTKALSQGYTVRQADGMLRDLYRVSPERRRLALDCARATISIR